MKIRCPDSGCGAVLNVPEGAEGKRIKCPKCGAVLSIKEKDASARSASTAGSDKDLCKVCGAELQPEAAICVQCGNRVGAAAVDEHRKRIAIVFGSAAGIMLLIVFAAVLLLTGKKEEPAPPPPERRPTVTETEADETVPDVTVEEEITPIPYEPEESKVEETKSLRLAAEYLDSVQSLHRNAEHATAEELAANWADLAVWCDNNNMLEEALMCALQACIIDPDNEAVRALVEKHFLTGNPGLMPRGSFTPRIRIFNRTVDNRKLEVQVGEGPEGHANIRRFDTLEVEVDPGEVNIQLIYHPDRREPLRAEAISVAAVSGRYTEMKLISRELLPWLKPEKLDLFVDALALWKRYKDPAAPQPDHVLTDKGWQKTETGWKTEIDGTKVEYLTGGEYDLTAVRVGDDMLSRLDGVPPGVVRRDRDYFLTGKLTLVSTETEAGPDERTAGRRTGTPPVTGDRRPDAAEATVIIGTADEPAVMSRRAGVKWGWLTEGYWESEGRSRNIRAVRDDGGYPLDIYIEFESGERDEIAHLFAQVSANYAAHREYSGIKNALTLSREKAKRKEARGELSGGWFTNLWISEDFRAEEEKWRNYAITAHAERNTPDYASRNMVEQIAGPDFRVLRWHPLRHRLVEKTSDAAGAVPDLITRLSLLPLMRDSEAVALIEKYWDKLDEKQQAGVLRMLRYMPSGPALKILSDRVGAGYPISVRRSALLTLGEIGTPEALKPCLAVVVEPELYGVSLAAAAAAGAPDVIRDLESIFSDAGEEELSGFIKALCELRGPGALTAMEAAIRAVHDAESLKAVAARLPYFRGNVAAYLLGRLTEKIGFVPEEAVGKFAPDRSEPLIPALKIHLHSSIRENADAASAALARIDSDAAGLVLLEGLGKGRWAAAMGLAAIGTDDMLEAAKTASEHLTGKQMERIREAWIDCGNGSTGLKDAVSRRAATEFLNAVADNAASPTARLRSVQIMREIGERIDERILMEIVRLTIPGNDRPAEEKQTTRQINGLPEDDADLRPDETHDKELDEETIFYLTYNALSLLPEMELPGIAGEMENLFEKAPLISQKGVIQKFMGRVAGSETLERLVERAGNTEYGPTQMAALGGLHIRLTALHGLAKRRHPQVAAYAYELLRESPPQLEEKGEGRVENFETLWVQRSHTGIMQMLGMLPENGETLLKQAANPDDAVRLIEHYMRRAQRAARDLSSPAARRDLLLALNAMQAAGDVTERAWQFCGVLVTENLPPAAFKSLARILANRVPHDPTAVGFFKNLFANKALQERREDGRLYEFDKAWQETALTFAERGGDAECEILSAGLVFLPPEIRYKAVRRVYESARPPFHEAYFKLAAEALALWSPQTPYRSIDDIYESAAAQAGKAEHDAFEWQAQWQFAEHCIKMLRAAPRDIFLELASSRNMDLLNNEAIGVYMALIARDHDRDFDLAAQLAKLFKRTYDTGNRLKIIAGARKDGSIAARNLLEAILEGRETIWDEEAVLLSADVPAVLGAAARALGDMGAGAILRRYAVLSETSLLPSVLDINIAAINGMAYLPPQQDPAERLFDIIYTTSVTPIQQACAESVLAFLLFHDNGK